MVVTESKKTQPVYLKVYKTRGRLVGRRHGGWTRVRAKKDCQRERKRQRQKESPSHTTWKNHMDSHMSSI